MNRLIVSLILLFALESRCQEVEYEVDLLNASPLFEIDLDKTPLTRKKLLYSFLASDLQDIVNKSVEKKLSKKLHAILSNMNRKLTDGSGFLIQIKTGADEFGTNFILPDAVLPIGIGLDPIDAYAQHLNTAWVSPSPLNAALKTTTNYAWVSKTNGSLSVAKIPSNFSSNLITQATVLARDITRNNVNQSFNPLSSNFPNYLARASYWEDRVIKEEEYLKSQNHFEKVSTLTKRFRELQVNQENLVRQYEEISYRLENNQSLLNLVKLFASFSDVLSTFSTSDTPTSEPVTYDPTIIKMNNIKIRNDIRVFKSEINITTEKIKKNDDQLKTFYPLM